MTMLRDVKDKWLKHRDAVETWKKNNREYYLMQKRILAARPEYLAIRRERYRARKNDDNLFLSTNKLRDDATRHENILG